MEGTERKQHESPAADAAGLLLRIGFAILVMAAPVAAIFSRRAFVVLVPVGAFLIIIAALINDPGEYFARARHAFASVVGLWCLALAVWILASLLWTPFPGGASERSFRLLGNVALATTVALALPVRMRTSNLHLMSIGAALATLALVLVAILGPGTIGILSNQEAPTLGRAATAISAMVWPAVAWTISRGRDHQGMALIGACGLAIFASGSMDAGVVLGTAMLVFLLARINAARASRILAIFLSLLVLLAPVVAMLGRILSEALRLAPGHVLTGIGLWVRTILDAPLRLITGHGFDTLYRARAVQVVDARAPAGLLSETWYDLGILGAVMLAAILYFGIRALSRLVPHVAAAALAGVAGIVVFMVIDPTATQAWWLSVCVVVSIMMVAVNNGQHRTVRPSAVIEPKRIRIGV
jgi:hypothetical protein